MKPPPLDPHQSPPLDRYCDLVLTGGVVNGALYPGAILELARHYRFKNLGGTSIGGAAAALTAAAEYARRYGSDVGFNEVIRALPDELAEPLAATPGAAPITRLRSLFQALPGMQRLLALFVAVTGDELAPTRATSGRLTRYWPAFWGAWRTHYLPVPALTSWFNHRVAIGLALVSTLIGIYPWSVILPSVGRWPQMMTLLWAVGMVAATVGMVMVVMLGMGCWRCAQDIRQLLRQEGWGLCSGFSGQVDQPAFIDWLHKGLQGAARLPMNRPLTFGDLWQAPGGPTAAARSIDLRMITAAIGQGRPYELPHTDRSARLFFQAKEWQTLFPPEVMAHLIHVAQPYQPHCEHSEPAVQVREGKEQILLIDQGRERWLNRADLLELPMADLPVLVAARMSLAVPVLFQAVPLWAVDPATGTGAARGLGRLWMVDGGLCMNFPVHLFDAPIPRWPTFGILLADDKACKSDDSPTSEPPDLARIEMPQFHQDHRMTGDTWSWSSRNRSRKTPDWLDYVSALFNTLKDWSQVSAMRMPGVKERVVTVYINPVTRSGFNLNLSSETLRRLGYQVGVEAAQALVARYRHDHDPLADPQLVGSSGWRDHRWVRMNTYLSAMKAHLQGLTVAVQAHGQTDTVHEQIQSATRYPPLKSQNPDEPEVCLSPVQAKALSAAIQALSQLERTLTDDAVVQPFRPSVQPELRSRPRI